MKKKYIVTSIAATVLCIVSLCAGIFVFPLLRAARVLQRVASADCVDFKLNITLNQDRLSQKQEQLLWGISRIFEVEESSCMSWNVNGYMSGRNGYAEVSCAGLEGPVTDVYFGGDDTVVNVRMFYEMLQKNFSTAHPILGTLLPRWNYSDYISLEQIEEIFDVDLKSMYKPGIPQNLSGKNLWKGLLLLSKMERKKSATGGLQFEMEGGGYHTVLEIQTPGHTPEVFLRGTDQKNEQMIASYEAAVSSGPGRETVYPDSVMGQDEIVQFRNLWDIVKGIQGKIGKEQ